MFFYRTPSARLVSLVLAGALGALALPAVAHAEDLAVLLSGTEWAPPPVRLVTLDDGAEPTPTPPQPRKNSRTLEAADVFDRGPVYTAMQPPVPPAVQPDQPIAPNSVTPALPNQPESFTPTGAGQAPLSVAEVEALATGPSNTVVQISPTAATSTPDVVGLITATPGGEAVSAQHQSQTSYVPIVRGFNPSEIYGVADGAYWFAARQDLDSMLSKIDPALVRDIIIIPGPFGVSYGPAFSYIDVQTEPVLRSRDGCFVGNYRTLANYNTNGAQGSAREIIDGAVGDWGFRLTAGISKGSDYTAGNGQKIPSAYQNTDEMAQIAYDLGPSTRAVVSYLRYDQNETQYPGRLFDMDNLGTDAFNVSLTNTDVGGEMTRWSIVGWSNRTDFHGSIHQHPEFPTVERLEAAVDLQEGVWNGVSPQTSITGTTSGNALSTGIRAGQQWGATDSTHINTGADFRFLQQRIAENVNVVPVTDAPFEAVSGIPTSHMADPGIYLEYVVPWTGCLKSSVGVRYDYVQTHASLGDLNTFTNNEIGDDLNKRNSLWAAYLTNEAKLTKEWTARLGIGYAENPPSLMERYSNAEFLGVAQSGFTRVFGTPQIGPERGWMVDASIQAEYSNFRSKVSGFYTWINNYITLEDGFVFGPSFEDARLVVFTPTRLATLTGFEWTGEYDINPCWSPFARMGYVYGTDDAIHTALFDMPPLTSTFGLRWHDPSKERPWQVEFFGRADYAQNHPGYIRSPGALDGSGLARFEMPTPGFCIWNIHAYYNYTQNFRLIAGIDNIFDRTYLQHLDLRLFGPTTVIQPGAPPGSPPVGTTVNVYPNSYVYQPGISGFFGFDWKF